MNDIVYIVGKGSFWQNNELKFSLRSLDMYMKNYRHVVIVGELPEFVNPRSVVHIPFEDTHKNKAVNIMRKVLRACVDHQLTENITVMNDDYFLLKDLNASKIPYYFKNTLDEAMANNVPASEFHMHLAATKAVLKMSKKPLLNFDGHYPIIYNRNQMAKIIDDYDWNNNYGYVLRSIYCNSLFITGEYKTDIKLNISRFEPAILKMIHGADCFSIGDKAINKSLYVVLKRLYPNKSKFEL